ncbi:MAG TPA: hypothetical protein VJM32_02165 [Candidatus Saccharimonadales bacterium]|nr:hypothetical protein [Candidatus Saccharimonadales bacterium]
MKYLATCISGTQEIIGQRLNAFSSGELRILELQNGLVIFESTLTQNQLSELRFFNNVYELLADGAGEVSELPVPHIDGTFTVRRSVQNQPTHIDDLKEHVIAKSSATFTAHRPETEFLLLERTDGRKLWGRLLPRAGFKQRTIEQGELRPELAHILGLVAGLDAKATVLDPFAGYGGIAREMLHGFHVKEMLAVERNEHLIPHLKSIPRVTAMHGDARQLAHVHTRSIDRIVTDPPWGEFTNRPESEMRALYGHSLAQMHRVLRAKGAVVMLTAAPFLPEVATASHFDVLKQYPILVNGRKATIYKLRKIG